MSQLLLTSPGFLRLQAQRHGEKGGIVAADGRLSYPALAATVDDLSAWLAARGCGAGDHIAVMAANSPALIATLFAVWGLGGVTVPIAVRSTVDETAGLLDHSRATALVCDEARADVGREAAGAAGIAAYVCAPELPLRLRLLRRGATRRQRSPREPRAAALATIAYTSGTTGAPKGVMITHANLLWATLACAQARGDRPDGVGACISPLTHTPVLVSHLLTRLLLGATAVLLEKFDLETLLEWVQRFAVTDVPLIGGMVFDMVSLGAIPESVRRTVEKVSVGGAPTPMEAKRALAGLFSSAEIIEAYGQSESTDGVTMARGTSVFDYPGTVGTANPFLVVAVRRSDGSLARVEEEGEIVVGGPTVMRGYFHSRTATAATIRDGWLHTGDVGRRNQAGYLFITGRVKDIIITGGENVSPAEVEGVLRTHPDVADVAVIGTPHPKWGEQVTAIVVPRPGTCIAASTLAEFAGTRLAGFKKPRRIEFVDTLPRNAANKVQVHVLKQRFATEDPRSEAMERRKA